MRHFVNLLPSMTGMGSSPHWLGETLNVRALEAPIQFPSENFARETGLTGCSWSSKSLRFRSTTRSMFLSEVQAKVVYHWISTSCVGVLSCSISGHMILNQTFYALLLATVVSCLLHIMELLFLLIVSVGCPQYSIILCFHSIRNFTISIISNSGLECRIVRG